MQRSSSRPSYFGAAGGPLTDAVQKYYEHKQYKKGLKVCEQILKKHPAHGESLAMKGLFLSNLSRKEEGYEHVRQGLKHSLRSHVCWHVYGLLYRADKNYDEAMKCYRNALRFDRENGQILRDLAVLQLQMRHYAGLCETRYQLLSLRPVVRLNWISLAIAYHLSQKHDQAVGVLDAVLDTFPLDSQTRACHLEQGELFFYKSSILEEAGRLPDALRALDRTNFAVLDALEWEERRASLLLRLGRHQDAAAVWQRLLDYNPDSRTALLNHLRSSPTAPEERSRVLQALHEKYPRSLLIRFEAIRHAPPDRLEHCLADLILPMARKGVLSALNAIRQLYRSPANGPALNRLCARVAAEVASGSEESAPWCHVLMAQHFSLLGDAQQALHHMERAAECRPDVPEIFLYYAKVLRRLGSPHRAADTLNYARLLDPSDRFLNSKTVKYFLRAGRVEEAKRLAVVFVKKGDFATQLQDLLDMQAIWFSHELGCAYQRQGDHDKALASFGQIFKVRGPASANQPSILRTFTTTSSTFTTMSSAG